MTVIAQAHVHISVSRRHKSLEPLKHRVRSNSNQAVYNAARGIVAEAKRRAPVRTGFLKSNIYWEKIKPGEYKVAVRGNRKTKTGAYYADYVEFGTRHMAAQPYMRPAIEIMKRQFKVEMRQVFK